MLDLFEVEIVNEIPKEIRALESSKAALTSNNQALVKDNVALRNIALGFFFIAFVLGLYFFVKQWQEHQEKMGNTVPAL